MENGFKRRIDYTGSLKNLSTTIVRDFALGKYLNHKIVTIGYEDFNYYLRTSKGRYFVKIFSTQRTPDDAKRIVGIMSQVYRAGIAIPELYESSQGYLHVVKENGITLRICVMSFVEGKDFFTTGKRLTNKDIGEIVYQTAMINKLSIRPKRIYDTWAISNFLHEFNKKKKYLDKADQPLFKSLVGDIKKLNTQSLPHCFTHGDIIKTNVLKDIHGRIWIVDFSVANTYPRIQELAVLACDVLFDRTSKLKSERMLAHGLAEYQKYTPLIVREKNSLPLFIKLAHAMHVLCATFEKKTKHNTSKENEYFLNIGKIGLRRFN
ncbi:MAG: phosphotransferase [Patescibacteria group bacterium]|jgi:Ser/Thr protein kinase RdoA (MazF antagonist)